MEALNFIRTPSGTKFSKGRLAIWQEALVLSFAFVIITFCAHGIFTTYLDSRKDQDDTYLHDIIDMFDYKPDISDAVRMHMTLASSVEQTCAELVEARNIVMTDMSASHISSTGQTALDISKLANHFADVHTLHKELGMLLGRGCEDEDIRKAYAVIGLTPAEYTAHVLATYDDLYRSELLRNMKDDAELGSTTKEEKLTVTSSQGCILPSYEEAVYGKFSKY